MPSRIRALFWCVLATQFVACAGAPATSGGSPAPAPAVAPAAASPGPALPERDEATAAVIEAALAGSHRSADSRSRDPFRHPVETLLFFGLKPGMTVAEVWPGAGGWYTEVLAPVLAGGRLYAAQMAAEPGNPYVTSVRDNYTRKLAERPEVYGNVTMTSLGAHRDHPVAEIAPPESCDLVLSFRGLHNWMSLGYEKEALAAMHRALKPGGTLGIVDHRGTGGQAQDPRASNGYVDENYAIALIESAGFELLGRSEINANPNDTRDYEQGVWSLPPELRQGNRDRAKFEAIGESDRFTLKFRKR
jgi:predicted methyltransferase